MLMYSVLRACVFLSGCLCVTSKLWLADFAPKLRKNGENALATPAHRSAFVPLF